MFGISTGVMAYNRTARRRQHIRFYYDRADAAAITMSIPDFRGNWVEWTLSRAALGDSYIHAVRPRHGDVHLLTNGDRLIITLRPGDHQVVISFPTEPVWEFIARTHNIVRPCRNNGTCRDDEGCPECQLLDTNLTTVLAELLTDQH